MRKLNTFSLYSLLKQSCLIVFSLCITVLLTVIIIHESGPIHDISSLKGILAIACFLICYCWKTVNWRNWMTSAKNIFETKE